MQSVSITVEASSPLLPLCQCVHCCHCSSVQHGRGLSFLQNWQWRSQHFNVCEVSQTAEPHLPRNNALENGRSQCGLGGAVNSCLDAGNHLCQRAP